MELVQPLRPARSARRAEPDRANGVVLFEFLGPVSPELALVDPELAERASALLPDAPGIRIAGRHETIELIPFSVPSIPARRTIRPALAIASTLLGLGVIAGIGWWLAPAALDREPSVQSGAPAAAPTVPPTQAPPATQSPTAPPIRPGSPEEAAAPFVWPAERGAVGYRVALYRDGRQIFELDVESASLQLPSSWTYEGRFHTLSRGTYRWVVWPLFGNGSTMRLGPAIVSARYTV